jgi:hypothetical protein
MTKENKTKKSKDRYTNDDELSAETAMVAAANMLLDAGNIAFGKQDTDTLLEAGDRLLRIGAVLMQVAELDNGESSSATSESEPDGSADSAEKATIGFVR